MTKLIPFLLAAAVVTPLALSTPAQAQSIRDIQRLEERVNEAKARGNWGAAQDLEVQLNMARLQYQRNNGMGEVNDRGYYNQNHGFYNNGRWSNNGNWNNGNWNNGNWNNANWNRNRNASWNRNNRDRDRDRDRWRQQQQQRGYYDQWGRWRTY